MRKGEKAVNILIHTFKVLKYLINPDHNDYHANHKQRERTALALRAPHRKVRREKHGIHLTDSHTSWQGVCAHAHTQLL